MVSLPLVAVVGGRGAAQRGNVLRERRHGCGLVWASDAVRCMCVVIRRRSPPRSGSEGHADTNANALARARAGVGGRAFFLPNLFRFAGGGGNSDGLQRHSDLSREMNMGISAKPSQERSINQG